LIITPSPELELPRTVDPVLITLRSNQNNDSVLPDRFFVQIIARASLKLKTSVARGMQSAFRRFILEQKPRRNSECAGEG
jgi:hypothetical protein